MFLSYSVLDSA